MKVYLASMFSDKDRVLARGNELAEMGIECTSRWPLETAPHNATIKDFPDEYFRETAVFDLQDIIAADKLVMFVPSDTQLMDSTPRSMSRGGRHFETGFFYGLIMAARHDGSAEDDERSPQELIVVGPRENVFHFLDGEGAAKPFPMIRQFLTWDECKAYLGGA
jgi:hypothetical protein